MEEEDLTNFNESDFVSSSDDSGVLFSDSDINEESSLAIDSEIIDITPTDDILITIHQEINKQTEILVAIHQQQSDFMMFVYFGFVVLVIIGVSKFLDKVLFRFI